MNSRRPDRSPAVFFRLGLVCEGDGDETALPLLVRRIETSLALGLVVGETQNAHGRGNLTVSGGVERFYRYAATSHDAVLIVLDSDEDCPVELARGLALRIRTLQQKTPAAIVAANAAFEAWFLADLASIEGQTVKGRVLVPEAAAVADDPDSIHNPKAALVQMIPRRTTYKETADQPSLASMIDLELVRERSRSFRRLLRALGVLGSAVAAGSADITP